MSIKNERKPVIQLNVFSKEDDEFQMIVYLKTFPCHDNFYENPY